MSFKPEAGETKSAFSTEKGVLDINEAIDPLPPHEVTFPEGGWRACYTNAHGVYNDKVSVTQFVHNDATNVFYSWIGSVQLFFVVSVGLFTGRAFDTGYLYVLE
ncbi:hypothetical protein C0991_000322 [Blastosporella zonata]|nr:hypothetical protein C0991_000322 [Blastosporella zonata]